MNTLLIQDALLSAKYLLLSELESVTAAELRTEYDIVLEQLEAALEALTEEEE